ncbi:serine hydrolase domain-containing protein [Halobacterium hubeiense]|uniref:serine hydrolase domain-containing protein n=1 Tax=Halobacterium hubeiense TaxID=1407499 RepID=UPI003C77FBE2
MPSTTTRRGFVAGVAAGSAALVGTGSAATARGSTRPRAGQSSLATVVSDALREAMAEYDADGATVGVVADGEPVLTEGVGHAYRNPDAPVDPEETLFRVGSVSKVPTFVAAMRLVDEGAVAADDPVAPHLDSVTVPGGGEPITLAHLATHTSGFEQRYVGQVATSVEDVRPLPAVLEANHPARVNSPGELPLYTNYNAGLAGQFVADVHGTDFETAVADLVFDRLGMTDSTFDPLPAALVGGRDDAADDVSWYSGMAPASGLSATAADAVALLRALATDGATPAGRVLSPAATAALRDQWHTPHDALAGIAFGMKRQRRGDTLVVGHQGSVRDFRTDFRLVPDDGAGLFVSVHGADANDVQAAVTDAFLEAVAPVEAPETAGDGGLDAASAVTGEYKPVMATDAASHEKLLYHLLASETTLRTTADGRLETVRGGTTHRWTAVSPRVFRRSDGADALVVESRADGGRYAFYASDPWSPLEAVPWHGRLAFHRLLAALATLAVLSGALGWPLAAGRRRFRGGDSPPPSLSRSRWLAGGATAALFAFAAVAVFGVFDRWLYDPPAALDLLFAVPALAAVATVAAAGIALRAWYRGEWTRLARVHTTLVVAGLGVLCLLYRYWNLLELPL